MPHSIGLGPVLSQLCNGDGKPAAYALRNLTSAERNYSQLEKEGLALIFGVNKFHVHIFDRKFTLMYQPQASAEPFQ